VVFALAEVLRAEELGEADDLRAETGGLADAVGGMVEVGGRVRGAGHLDEADDGVGVRHLKFFPQRLKQRQKQRFLTAEACGSMGDVNSLWILRRIPAKRKLPTVCAQDDRHKTIKRRPGPTLSGSGQ
jgi:hypothetical protein